MDDIILLIIRCNLININEMKRAKIWKEIKMKREREDDNSKKPKRRINKKAERKCEYDKRMHI